MAMTEEELNALSPDEQAAEMARQAQIVESMKEQGIVTEDAVMEDYFDVEEEYTCYLPDRKQYIVHRVLNEGARRKYLNKQNRDVTVEKVTGNAKVKVMPGEERHALLEAAIVGWSMFRKDKAGEMVPLTFSQTNLKEFLEKASTKIIDMIEKDVRKHNAWLLTQVTADDIREQIAELEEMLEAKIKEEEGKES